MTKLSPVSNIPHYAVIIRCIHCRGNDQAEAFIELKARGLWLSEEQKNMAYGVLTP